MSNEYCAGSYCDAENFQKMLSNSWWEAALEYADENEDEILEVAKNFAAARIGIELGQISDDKITAEDKAKVSVGVGRARNPVPLSEMVKGASGAQRFLECLTESHDDYQMECAEDWDPLDRKPQGKVKDILEELAAGISDALVKFEREGGKPTWFIVDRAEDITFGMAEELAQVAAKIDLTGKLQRHPVDASLWLETCGVDNGKAQELKSYTIWQAAALLGIHCPEKPKGWRL